MAKSETIVFETLPLTPEELRKMPQAAMKSPFEVAALTVAALCRYEDSTQDAVDMLNVLRGSRHLTPYDLQFLRDRLAGKGYIPRSYLDGAVPQNSYEPSVPYSVTVYDDPSSYSDDGFAKLNLRSSGADSPRHVQLRRKGDQWFLWENFLLSDVKQPDETNEWA